MKLVDKLIITIPILLFWTNLSIAQDGSHGSPETVEINFETMGFDRLPKSLKKGEFYQIKIKNINLNLYSVSIDHNDSTLQSIDFPSFDFAGLEGLTGLVNELLPKEIVPISNNENKINQDDLSPIPNESFSDFVGRLNLNLTNLQDSLQTYQIFFAEQGRDLRQELEKLKSFLIKVEGRIISHLVEGDTSWNERMQNDFTAEDLFQQTLSFRKTYQELQKYVSATEQVYMAFYEKNKETIDKDSDLKKKHETNLKILSELMTLLENALGTLKPEAVQEWLKSVVYMDNTGRSYTSLPLQLKGDFTDLSIKIVPRSKEFGLEEYYTNIRLPKVSGWYLGVGTSIYWSSLSDDQYSKEVTRIDSTTSYFKVIDEEPSDWEAGISTLMYAGRTFGKSVVGWQFSLGPSISLSKPVKPRLRVGLGLSFGKSNKFTVDGFVIAGSVSRLSKSIEVDESVEAKTDNIPESVTVSKFKVGCGLSVGYLYTF